MVRSSFLANAGLRYSAIPIGLSRKLFGWDEFVSDIFARPAAGSRLCFVSGCGFWVTGFPRNQRYRPTAIQIVHWGISNEKATSSGFGGRGLLRPGFRSRHGCQGADGPRAHSVRDALDRFLDLGRLRIWPG